MHGTVERYSERPEAWAAVYDRVLMTDVVLDVGAGIRPQDYFTPDLHICVEAHQPYIDQVAARIGTKLFYLRGTWETVLRSIPDNTVDTAFALDFIEHITKEEGLQLLVELRRIARKQIVVFTPCGYYPQTYAEHESDAWGMDGTHWQTHRSGWEPEDFHSIDKGWEVVVCENFHPHDQHGEKLEKPFPALWAIQTFGETSRLRSVQTLKHREAMRTRALRGPRRIATAVRSPRATAARVFKRWFP